MDEQIDVNEFRRKQRIYELERGSKLTQLARTQLQKLLLREAWKTCQDAEEILNQYPGTTELSNLLTLQGDIAPKLSLDAEPYFIKAKSEIVHPFKDKIQKTSSAEARKHYGLWLSKKGRSPEAKMELEKAADIYKELGKRSEALICKKEIFKLDSRGKGTLQVFENFFHSVQELESNLEICLLAWQGHLDMPSSHVVAKRSNGNHSLGLGYCKERIEEAREKWRNGSRLLLCPPKECGVAEQASISAS